MKNTFIISMILLIIISCSPKTAPTAAKQNVEQATASATPVDMAVAEEQFKQVCGSCHGLPDPKKHTAAEWPNTVNRMQRKKGFDDNQKIQILAFLEANAKP